MSTTVNLFLCAAPRSGSTQLAAWLDTHPDISLLPVKEPNHFSSQDFDPVRVRETHLNDVDPEAYVRAGTRKFYQFAVFRDPAHYAHLAEGLATRWVMDASTSYLQSDGAIARIRAYNPQAVVVVLLRDPVERALSHLRLAQRTGRTRRSLPEQLAAEGGAEAEGFLLRFSRYRAALARLAAEVPEEQIVRLRFEDMVADPARALAPLCARLGIDVTELDLAAERRNAGDAPRFPRFNAWAMESGLKPLVGRVISPELKTRLRGAFFQKAAAEDGPAPKARAALEAALSDEVAAYRSPAADLPAPNLHAPDMPTSAPTS
ncbi:MAG: sulfotransferase [Pseudomonadota bacterium]